MPEIVSSTPVNMVSLEAVVIRADGTREDLGTIAYYHRNPLRRLWFKLTGKVA